MSLVSGGGCCGDKPQELCLKNPLIPETAIKAEEGRQYGFPSQKTQKRKTVLLCPVCCCGHLKTERIKYIIYKVMLNFGRC